MFVQKKKKGKKKSLIKSPFRGSGIWVWQLKVVILLYVVDVQVGAQVEVRQPDGTTLAASLAKVTDHSTYTVGKILECLLHCL